MYFLQLSPPSLVTPIAEWLDLALWKRLEGMCGFAIPGNEQQGGLVLRVPIPGLDYLTFQQWVLRLPVRLYGWGFRSLKDVCGPAYIGALETAIPYIAGRGETPLAPQMSEIWGGEER